MEEATAFTTGKDVSAIGFFTDQSTDAAKALLAAASNRDDRQLAITSSTEIAAEHKVKGEAVLPLKTFDNGSIIPSGGIIEKAVVLSVSSESLSGEIKSHLLAFLSAKAGSHTDDVAMAADIAKDHKRILEFFDIPEAENIKALVAKSLYLKLLAVNRLVFPKDLKRASTLFTLEHLCLMYQSPSRASPVSAPPRLLHPLPRRRALLVQ